MRTDFDRGRHPRLRIDGDLDTWSSVYARKFREETERIQEPDSISRFAPRVHALQELRA